MKFDELIEDAQLLALVSVWIETDGPTGRGKAYPLAACNNRGSIDDFAAAAVQEVILGFPRSRKYVEEHFHEHNELFKKWDRGCDGWKITILERVEPPKKDDKDPLAGFRRLWGFWFIEEKIDRD